MSPSRQILAELLYRQYWQELRFKTPDSPALKGRKAYSQNDEDGIIEEIFSRVGAHPRVFVEIGCGDGRENNSHLLGIGGWSGVWIDGSRKNIQTLRSEYEAVETGRFRRECLAERQKIVVAHRFMSRENAQSVVAECLNRLGVGPEDVAFLSVDIDGNDLEIADSILGSLQPHCLSIEYNAIFPPSVRYETPYQESFVWKGDDHFGSSLLSICERLSKRDYSLICCNLSGVNAFFAHRKIIEKFERYDVGDLYVAPRHDILAMHHIGYGHRRSLKNLATNADLVFL